MEVNEVFNFIDFNFIGPVVQERKFTAIGASESGQRHAQNYRRAPLRRTGNARPVKPSAEVRQRPGIVVSPDAAWPSS
jgi:hypothetical protein